ncbi:MAG TPA: hypothetical protein VGQ84_10805 [Gaiellaceae bacterium]|jgi:hypothetical protein|nr:hypothetical protein [Gaiellaceae bacterium]
MPSLLSDLLPRWDVRKRHTIELSAPPERVWTALNETTLGDMPVARLLFRVRGLPSARERGLLDLEGFQRIAEDPGRELVVGAVGRPWIPTARLRRDADVRTFSEPGYAKMALNVTYDGQTLATETRVALTDSRSRRWFRLYWLVIGPFSGVVRKAWLRAIARRVGPK